MNTLIDFDRAVVVAIPVRAGFGEVGDRECMLIEGPQGWGEFSPPPAADDRLAARWLTAATEPGTVGWPDPVRGRIPVAIGVPPVDAAQAAALVAESGCHTAEIWVGAPGSTLAEDIARVEAVRDALGADGQIRCAAIGAWDVRTAADLIPALARAAGDLQYVEQPCGTLAELAALRRRIDVPIAADAALIHSAGP
ncbi:enolase C-terminal domain-like protein, partial [Micromonospora sp. WMMD736]|uniref:enolase C-terminal domain-like protein n=1 Tax=Micromonospora sp. WMMD736 TaxID=3404112 RepID=UPI003B94D835